MKANELGATLEELRLALRVDATNGRERLERLRRDALSAGDTSIAALALWGIAQKELDLDRRAKLQRALITESPTFLAYQALADTETGLGRLEAARGACQAALSLADRPQSRAAIRQNLREIDRALAGGAEEIQRLRDHRMQQERDLAIARSRFEPSAATARLWRQRRKAAASGDRVTASVFLAALVDLAQQSGGLLRAVRLARMLVSEIRDVWTLHRLGDAERSAGMYAGAIDSYASASALAKRRGDGAQLKVIQEKLRALRSQDGVARKPKAPRARPARKPAP